MLNRLQEYDHRGYICESSELQHFAHKTCRPLPSLLCKKEFCKENCARVLTSKLGCGILTLSRKLGNMFGQKFKTYSIYKGVNIMNKEEILAMSRQENKEKDLYEMQVSESSANIGLITGAIICALLFALEIFICGTTNYGLWSIVTGFNAAMMIYKGIKLKKKSSILIGIMWATCTIAATAVTISDLFATSTIL